MNINPIVIDGKEWPLMHTELSIASRYDESGTLDASISARFIPTRIENGVVKHAEDNAITIYRGSLKELQDINELNAMAAIKSALEQFVASKIS